jgi:hypothetical protein
MNVEELQRFTEAASGGCTEQLRLILDTIRVPQLHLDHAAKQAVKHGQSTILQLLFKKGAELNGGIVAQALLNPDPAIFQVLHENGWDVEQIKANIVRYPVMSVTLHLVDHPVANG